MNTRYRVAFMAFYADGDGVIKALLQKRGRKNYFKMQPQTWPDVCQATVQGKVIVAPPESPFSGVKREIIEELGASAGEKICARLDLEGTFSRRILYEDSSEKVGVFGLMIGTSLISAFRLEPISGGLIEVAEKDISNLVVARPEHRLKRHRYTRDVVMPYVIPALHKGFERIRLDGTL